jgi:error-prone DNA polymerase
MGGGSLAPGTRRVLVHASGFRQSPYADVKPAGESVRGGRALATSQTVPDDVPGGTEACRATGPERDRPERDGDDLHDLGMPPRKLWHASPGSSGH